MGEITAQPQIIHLRHLQDNLIMQVLIYVIYGVFIFTGVWFVLIEPSRIREKRMKSLKKLNQSRDISHLDEFYDFFLKKGYSKELIQLVLKMFYYQISYDKFIPMVSDSFKNDYLWTNIFLDQHRTYQMRLAALVLREISAISISEKDWDEFQFKNGEIDNFPILFNYLATKIPASPSMSK